MLALPAAPASAQIERHELAPLPGTEAPDRGSGSPSFNPAFPGLGTPPAPSALPDHGAPPGNAPLAPSPLPLDLWNGMDPGALGAQLADLALPSPSPVLADLLARALDTDKQVATSPVGLLALSRSGQVEALIDVLGGSGGFEAPGQAASYALALLADGREEDACGIRLGPPAKGAVDGEALRAAFLIPAYCAAAKGNAQGAGLTLQLAADSGIEAPLAAAVIGRLTKSGGGGVALPKSPDLLDYLFLRLEKRPLPEEIAVRATPMLLYRLAQDDEAPPELRLAAAERAASENIINGEALAKAYRETGSKLGKGANSPPALRARLFVALEAAPTPKIKAESIDALLASGSEAGVEFPLAEALAPGAAELGQDQQAASFIEARLRVAALAGDLSTASRLANADEALKGWQLLLAAADPTDPNAQSALAAGVETAARSGLPPALLQRLVTVLDALDVDVPIPLWDEAGKSPQPDDGYLPATGVLTKLKEAAEKGEVGRTILLVMASLGPKGPAGANLLALGDSVRALNRVGLTAEARRVGFEALYPRWPARGKA